MCTSRGGGVVVVVASTRPENHEPYKQEHMVHKPSGKKKMDIKRAGKKEFALSVMRNTRKHVVDRAGTDQPSNLISNSKNLVT